jgi:signal transduction histidine kinase
MVGLFISKSIIDAHGSKVWAKNNADGKGDTFYFSLPISKRYLIQKNRKPNFFLLEFCF